MQQQALLAVYSFRRCRAVRTLTPLALYLTQHATLSFLLRVAAAAAAAVRNPCSYVYHTWYMYNTTSVFFGWIIQLLMIENEKINECARAIPGPRPSQGHRKRRWRPKAVNYYYCYRSNRATGLKVFQAYY